MSLETANETAPWASSSEPSRELEHMCTSSTHAAHMQILSAAVDAADVDQACRVALCWFSPAHGTACAGASGTWNALAARLFAQAPVLVPNDPRANFYALCNRVAEYRSGERTAPVATDRNVRAFVLAAAYWNAADKKVTDLWRKQDTKTDTAETMPGTHNLAGANEDSPTSVVPRPESAAVMRLKQMASMASASTTATTPIHADMHPL